MPAALATRAPSRALALPRPDWYRRCKPVLDFVLALVGLVLAAPLLAVIAVAVKLTSRGPIFYSQTRLGKHGRPFRIWKVRTMAHDCEHISGPRWASADDPRITRVGHFLRRAHLDE